MGSVLHLATSEEPEFKDGDGDEPEALECDCGNTLMQVSTDFTIAYCPLCGSQWVPE